MVMELFYAESGSPVRPEFQARRGVTADMRAEYAAGLRSSQGEGSSSRTQSKPKPGSGNGARLPGQSRDALSKLVPLHPSVNGRSTAPAGRATASPYFSGSSTIVPPKRFTGIPSSLHRSSNDTGPSSAQPTNKANASGSGSSGQSSRSQRPPPLTFGRSSTPDPSPPLTSPTPSTPATPESNIAFAKRMQLTGDDEDDDDLIQVFERRPDPDSPIAAHRGSTPIRQKVSKRLIGGYDLEPENQRGGGKAGKKKDGDGASSAAGKGETKAGRGGTGKAVPQKRAPLETAAGFKRSKRRVSSPVEADDEEDLEDVIVATPEKAAPKRRAAAKAKPGTSKTVLEVLDDDPVALILKPQPRKGKDKAAPAVVKTKARTKEDEHSALFSAFATAVPESPRRKRKGKVDESDELAGGLFSALAMDKENGRSIAKAKEAAIERLESSTAAFKAGSVLSTPTKARMRADKETREYCPYCGGDMPVDADQEFWNLGAVLRSISETPKKPKYPFNRKIELTKRLDFCAWHEALTKIIPAGLDSGYPEHLDFLDLPRRLETEEIRTALEGLAEFPLRSAKFTEFGQLIDAKGRTWWKTAQLKQPAVVQKQHVGYYGEIGRAIISYHIKTLLAWGHYPNLIPRPGEISSVDPMTPDEYIEHILIPEAGVLLIKQDLDGEELEPGEERGDVRKKAEGVWAQSREYGMWKFKDSEKSQVVQRDAEVMIEGMKKEIGAARAANRSQGAARKKRRREIEEKVGGGKRSANRTPDPIVIDDSDDSELSDAPDEPESLLSSQASHTPSFQLLSSKKGQYRNTSVKSSPASSSRGGRSSGASSSALYPGSTHTRWSGSGPEDDDSDGGPEEGDSGDPLDVIGSDNDPEASQQSLPKPSARSPTFKGGARPKFDRVESESWDVESWDGGDLDGLPGMD